MINFLLRYDRFPLRCHQCSKQYSDQLFLQAIKARGLIYADCGDIVYQGFSCIHCGTPILYPFPRTFPLVDLQQFFIMPNAYFLHFNVMEFFFEVNRRDSIAPFLHFDFIHPLWDLKAISEEEISRLIPAILPETSNMYGKHRYIPYLMDQKEIWPRFQEEVNTQKRCFRRFYPKNTFWYCLLFSTMPGLLAPCYRDANGIVEDVEIKNFYSATYNLVYNSVKRFILEETTGLLLANKIRDKLLEIDIHISDEEIESLICEHQLEFYSSFPKTMADLSLRVDFADHACRFASNVFFKIYRNVCSFIYLRDKRKELSSWVHKVEPGKALFVDAPMGLGKTHSIIQTLVDNTDLSTVIFMPTKKLCEETVEQLKFKIAIKQGLTFDYIDYNKEDIKDEEGEVIFDEYGIPEQRIKRDFLIEDVYYMDGINKDECPQYNVIIKRYAHNWIKKGDLCLECVNVKTCRFKNHKILAQMSRIVVTTHSQYQAFSHSKHISKWNMKDRDFYIIDEDIVIGLCYHPIVLSGKDFKWFVSAITEAFQNEPFEDDDVLPITNHLLNLLGQFDIGDESMVIAPLDPIFEISPGIKKKWENLSLPEYQGFIPDYLHGEDIVLNLLDVFENAIRHGYVVQSYKIDNAAGKIREIRKAYLPNPTSFDLEKLPPHVFFDGTMIKERFLHHKLRGVSFEKMNINVPSLWSHRIFQNINSDLPRKDIVNDQKAVQQFVADVFEEEGPNKKYFIVSLKETRTTHLEQFVKSFPDYNVVFNHYGNLRGFNEAKECDVAIMIGSYIVSDALEIAMTLELFTEEMRPNSRFGTKGKLWRLVGKKPIREYYPEYSIIGEMAKTIQLNEHRQAIARTRYISHDVTFYIVSRVPITSYEHYFETVVTDQYQSDLFPPRPIRIDNIYEKVKEAAFQWLAQNKTVIAMNLHKSAGIGRHTVSKHLKTMFTEGLLAKASKTKYKLPEK